jgi:hypothetical protein
LKQNLWHYATVLPFLAASVAWAQVPLTESDLEWRKSPRPEIASKDRKHTPASLPDNSKDSVTPIWSIETADTTLSARAQPARLARKRPVRSLCECLGRRVDFVQ